MTVPPTFGVFHVLAYFNTAGAWGLGAGVFVTFRHRLVHIHTAVLLLITVQYYTDSKSMSVGNCTS